MLESINACIENERNIHLLGKGSTNGMLESAHAFLKQPSLRVVPHGAARAEHQANRRRPPTPPPLPLAAVGSRRRAKPADGRRRRRCHSREGFYTGASQAGAQRHGRCPGCWRRSPAWLERPDGRVAAEGKQGRRRWHDGPGRAGSGPCSASSDGAARMVEAARLTALGASVVLWSSAWPLSLAGSLAASPNGSWSSRGSSLGQKVFLLGTRWMRCLVVVDKRRRLVLGVAWRCSGRKPSNDLVGAGGGGA
jgi:hypothetical protein